ncbi:MAG TPA: replication initiator protein A [Candidatus Paceibacterota bacterium]|nr:replication initiator protein A [Verrucomicrobiota bacterium]HRY49989.1 replication initiator protein A [Candidatus Paceibacterota bacterium]
MQQAHRIESDLMTSPMTEARDELNLAEFPLCTLATRLRPGQKTLSFHDSLWDRGRGVEVKRQLIITGSDAYGLPTALDDEVLLGLIQLSKLQDFSSRQVLFTRYQLIRVLGWRNDGNSYARLEESLNRWTGVTLYYDNAWWNKTARRWMSEKFHILDNVRLCHRTASAKGNPEAQDGPPVSAFLWNEVVFRSFQAGNLKSIDFEFFKSLEGAVTKRVYRFLDKRFFHRPRCEFDLREFACEHIGLARGYDAASLKRKLRAAIAELENKGFLSPLPESQRFRKLAPKRWSIVLIKAKRPRRHEPNDAPLSPKAAPDVAAMIKRGVTPSTAREIAQMYPPESVNAHVEVFDWLQARKDPAISRNPAGFLVSSIRRDFAPPPDFLRRRENHREDTRDGKRKRKRQEQQRQRAERDETVRQEADRAVQEFLESLSEDERAIMKDAALAQASEFHRRCAARPGPLGTAAAQAALLNYVHTLVRQTH